MYNNNLNLCGFLDDDKSKNGQFIKNYKIFMPDNLNKIKDSLNIDEIIISANLNKEKFSNLYEIIQNTQIKILQIPNLSNVI